MKDELNWAPSPDRFSPAAPPLPPLNVQKRVKIGENKTTSNFWIPVEPPPPLGHCMKERCYFFLMASLREHVRFEWLYPWFEQIAVCSQPCPPRPPLSPCCPRTRPSASPSLRGGPGGRSTGPPLDPQPATGESTSRVLSASFKLYLAANHLLHIIGGGLLSVHCPAGLGLRIDLHLRSAGQVWYELRRAAA